MPPEAGGTKATSGTTPGEPAADGNFDPGSGTRWPLQSPGNRPASPGDIADQRHGLNPGHDERHSPRRCIAALSPTAALQSVPETSAARRRIKPRTHPAGSTAGRHPGNNPREPTRRSSGAATISPSAATQRNPKNAEGQGLSRSRQAKTRE